MPKKDITVIQLRTATRERLKEIGKKGESYDAIINQILDDRNISGARSSHDWSRGYSLPLHPEVFMSQELIDLYGMDLTVYFFYMILNSSPDAYNESLTQHNNIMWEHSFITSGVVRWMDKNVGYF